MKDSPDTDRRDFSRTPTDEVVSVDADDKTRVLGLSIDVSRGGMRLQCVGIDAAPDRLIRIALTLGRETCLLHGRITRVKDLDGHTKEIAVSFVDLDEAALRFLSEYTSR